jgi:hypothetical protein
MPRKKATTSAPDKISTLVSMSQADPTSVEAMQQKIDDLQAALEKEREARSEAEERAMQMAESQVSFSPGEEIPTGRKRSIRVFDKLEIVGYKDDANGRPILRPTFKTVSVPTYFLKINLPPSGGDHFSTNGEEFYHGSTYEFDMDTIRDVKARVWACWKHDQEIHGSDENAYRPKLSPTISAKGMRA